MTPPLRKALALAGSVALTAGVAALALWIDGGTLADAKTEAPDTAAAPADLLLPAPERVDMVSGARGVRANGVQMDVDMGTTDEDAQVVLDHYLDRFREAGLETLVQESDDVMLISTTEQGRTLSIALLDLDGQVGIITTRGAGFFRPGLEASQMPLPMPDDRSALFTNVSEDAGRKSASAQFVTGLSLEDAAQWYRSALGALGYAAKAPIDGPEDDGVRLLRFQGAAAHATVSLRSLGPKGTAVLLLHESGHGLP